MSSQEPWFTILLLLLSCVVVIRGRTTEQDTTIVFQKQGDKVTVYIKDIKESDELLRSNLTTLRVESKKEISVIFDCPERCYQFEKAVLPIPYPKDAIASPLRVYMKITDMKKEKESDVIVTEGKKLIQNTSVYIYNWNMGSAPKDQWFLIDISIDLQPSPLSQQKENSYDYLFTLININFISNGELVRKFALPVIFKDQHMEVHFSNCFGVRWAVNCQPEESKPPILTPRLLMYWVHVCLTFIDCLLVTVGIGACAYFAKQNRERIATDRDIAAINSNVPSIVRRRGTPFRNPTWNPQVSSNNRMDSDVSWATVWDNEGSSQRTSEEHTYCTINSISNISQTYHEGTK